MANKEGLGESERKPLARPSRLQLGREGLVVYDRTDQGRAELRVVGEQDPTITQSFYEKTIALGRSSKNDIVLRDTTASRSHARIFQEEGEWYLEDLGATNETLAEPIDSYETGPIKLPEDTWGFVPSGREIIVQVGQISLAIERRAGIHFVQETYQGITQEYSLEPDKLLTVGRDEENNIVSLDPKLSNNHLSLILSDEGVFLRDNDSTNGTRLTSQEKSDGEKNTIGRNIAYLERELGNVYSEESLGGNAGGDLDTSIGELVPAAGANFYIDRNTGELALFSNYPLEEGVKKQNPNLIPGGFKIISNSNNKIKIVGLYSHIFEDLASDLSEEAKLALYNTIARWNGEDELPLPEK